MGSGRRARGLVATCSGRRSRAVGWRDFGAVHLGVRGCAGPRVLRGRCACSRPHALVRWRAASRPPLWCFRAHTRTSLPAGGWRLSGVSCDGPDEPRVALVLCVLGGARVGAAGALGLSWGGLFASSPPRCRHGAEPPPGRAGLSPGPVWPHTWTRRELDALKTGRTSGLVRLSLANRSVGSSPARLPRWPVEGAREQMRFRRRSAAPPCASAPQVGAPCSVEFGGVASGWAGAWRSRRWVGGPSDG